MVAALTNPTLYTALATLLVALTALIKVFHVERQGAVTQAKLEVVDTNTNGALAALNQNVVDLRGTQATPAELAARPGAPGLK
jgi:hypothetical protein